MAGHYVRATPIPYCVPCKEEDIDTIPPYLTRVNKPKNCFQEFYLVHLLSAAVILAWRNKEGMEGKRKQLFAMTHIDSKGIFKIPNVFDVPLCS